MKLFRRRESENGGRLRLPLSAWLSYLLIATLLFTGVSFSRFAATASVSDSVTVAGFGISGAEVTTADTLSIEMPGSPTTSYIFTVSNVANSKVSQVSMRYKILLTFPQALPDGVSVSLAPTSSPLDPCSFSKSNNTYTFTAFSDFAAGVSATHSYTLSFTGDSSLSEDSLLKGITVKIAAEQID